MGSIFSKLKARLRPTGAVDPLPTVVLYTRQRCHLCEEAKELLDRLQNEVPFELEMIDIDHDQQLRAQFNDDVPVIYINGRKAFKHRIYAGKFLKSVRSGNPRAL